MKAKRPRDAAASRLAILEAAQHVFAARGFHAARSEDIAAAAGVAKGTVFLHFQNKDNLLLELVKHRCEAFTKLHAELMAVERPPRERLELLIDVQAWVGDNIMEFRRTMISMWMSLPPELRKSLEEHIREVHTQLRHRVAAIYRELLGADGVDGSSAEELAAALLACVDGLIVRLKFPTTTPSMAAVTRAAKMTFIDNLERRALEARQKGERKNKS